MNRLHCFNPNLWSICQATKDSDQEEKSHGVAKKQLKCLQESRYCRGRSICIYIIHLRVEIYLRVSIYLGERYVWDCVSKSTTLGVYKDISEIEIYLGERYYGGGSFIIPFLSQLPAVRHSCREKDMKNMREIDFIVPNTNQHTNANTK